jgi:2-oxoglutarate dehydrogenase E2 component (dihydrolipoamide succinyltransferase)
MKEDVTVPSVGESVTSGILTAWLKAEGEGVEEGEDLFELETDKASVAVPAPASGVLHILVPKGEEVQIGQVVGSLVAGEEQAVADKAPAGKQAPARTQKPRPQAASAEAASAEAASAQAASTEAAAPARPATAPAGKQAPGGQPPAPPPAARGRQTREPMSPLRQVLAGRLVQVRQQTALLTTFNEVDMEQILQLRRSYGEQFEKSRGVRLGLMSFFVKACCVALKRFPMVNAFLEGQQIVYNHYYDIGVAVSTERGLLVPIIRDADTLGLAEIERRVAELAQRAREKKILPDELAGGTFTITNGGVFGSLLSTPLPSYPQSAILGMHAIQNRPVALGDQVVIRPMMYLALSYDHRLIDGREAVQFLVLVKGLIEDPRRFILED